VWLQSHERGLHDSADQSIYKEERPLVSDFRKPMDLNVILLDVSTVRWFSLFQRFTTKLQEKIFAQFTRMPSCYRLQ